MNNIYIYKHTSPSGKVYIGQTCQKPEHRWDNGKGYKSGYFASAIKKYGWDNFKHEILFKGLDQLNADIIEEDLIFYYKSILEVLWKLGMDLMFYGYLVQVEKSLS